MIKKIDISSFFPKKLFDFKNFEKNTFFLLVVIWIFVILIVSFLQIRLKMMYTSDKKKSNLKLAKRLTSKEISSYEALFEKMKKPESLSYYNILLDRDLFAEVTQLEALKGPVYEIKNIEKVPLPMMYKGFIQREDGALIAQLNFETTTHFTKVGDKIKGFRVTEVTKESVTLIGPNNKKILLRKNKLALSDEFQVVIFDSANKKNLILKKNDMLSENYKIIDINNDSVILLKENEKIEFKKGDKLDG